jgi:hypothetical protein
MSYTILSTPPATGATLTPSVTSPQVSGTGITFTAGGIGGSGSYEYKFVLNIGSTSTVVRDYSSSNTWAWNTGGVAAGTYTVLVYVRNAGSPATYETAKGISYSITN